MPFYRPYTQLSTLDSELSLESDKPPSKIPPTQEQRRISSCFILCVALACFAAGLTSGILIIRPPLSTALLSPPSTALLPPNSPTPSCTSPRTRREWRYLSASQKHAYIDAVQCLRSKPSALSLPQSLYDDFPYVHMHVGNVTHDTAGFLPWHRYFVHVYEVALRDRCNYTGDMPYWDWTLDWADFRRAPVWDPETGFGGDGGADAPKSVGQGRCVTDGPFAGLKALYSNLRLRPHCLARGFPGEKELARWTSGLRPEAVEEVVAIKEYEKFYLALENGPHLAIPYSVRGDFYRFTAPYGKFSGRELVSRCLCDKGADSERRSDLFLASYTTRQVMVAVAVGERE